MRWKWPHLSDSVSRPRATGDLTARVAFDAYASTDIATVMDAGVPLTVAANSLNRSMGVPDLYLFVLASKVVEKLAFIQTLVHRVAVAKCRAPRRGFLSAHFTFWRDHDGHDTAKAFRKNAAIAAASAEDRVRDPRRHSAGRRSSS